MQTVPIISLYFYKSIVHCNQVPWNKKQKKLESVYTAIFESQSIFELLESKPVQEILKEQQVVDSPFVLQ